MSLMLSTMNIVHKINASVNDDTWGSDHYPIFVNFQIEKSIYCQKSFKLKSKRTDWSKVSFSLENALFKFFTPDYDRSPPG